MQTDNEIVQLRKELHQHPEISGEEFATKERIIQFFNTLQPDDTIHLGKTGVAFVFNGASSGKTVMLRCELDALPIQEKNTIEHLSKTNGKAHLCGHDGHMSILAAVGKYLSKNRPEKGRIVLLYQPAEENGEGAKEVLADANFKKIIPDFAVSLHNVPGYPKGQIVYKYNNVTPSVTSIILHFTGKTSHAAEPHKGFNPSLAIAAITQYAVGLQRNMEDDEQYSVVTPVFTHIGSKAYGTSAGLGETHFTIRTLNNECTKHLAHQIIEKATNLAQQHQLELNVAFTESFEANENNEEIVNTIKQVAEEQGFSTIEKKSPFPWGEDFGLFTTTYKGAMFGLGSGEDTPRLHNPDYDFPDEIAPIGTAMFINIAKKLLT